MNDILAHLRRLLECTPAKRNYSLNPWRAVDSDGREAQLVGYHEYRDPYSGRPSVAPRGPLCAPTKTALEAELRAERLRVLDLLAAELDAN